MKMEDNINSHSGISSVLVWTAWPMSRYSKRNIERTKLKRKLCKKVFITFRVKGMESENLRSMGVVESCWLCVLVEGRFNAKK